jgi:hypothetical protein
MLVETIEDAVDRSRPGWLTGDVVFSSTEAMVGSASFADLLLSLLFSSLCRSRMASSMELVIDNLSAVASSWAMFPAADPERINLSGTTWLMAGG